MLDTIRVKFPIDPTEEQLENWTRRTTRSLTGQSDVFIYNPVIDEAMLKFTYRPFDFKGKPILTLEVSLPKLIFDNNYQMLSSIDGTIKIANILLDGVPHVPKLDLAEGVLIRLDMCYNHQVGDAVEDYIKAIGNLDYPHRRTKHHRYEGAEFRAKHKTTKFYNKERESGYIEAYGILRQEITLINGKDIQKLFRKKQPTLMDVSSGKIVECLEGELERLGLLGNSIATRDTALKSLCDAHGDNAGIYYYGLLISKLDKSRKEIKQKTGTHPRSLDRKLRKIVDARVPLTLTERDKPLPSLRIEL
jgi:hypothetical protein